MEYDKTKNPLAGPFWDRRMMAAEGRQIASETQVYEIPVIDEQIKVINHRLNDLEKEG